MTTRFQKDSESTQWLQGTGCGAKTGFWSSSANRQRLKENPDGLIIAHGREVDYELMLEDEVPRRINAEDAMKELKATKQKARRLAMMLCLKF